MRNGSPSPPRSWATTVTPSVDADSTSVGVRFGGAIVAERFVAVLQRVGQAAAHLFDELVHGLLLGAERAQLGAGANGGTQTHDLHAPVHDALVELGHVFRHERDALGDANDLVVEIRSGER